MVGNYEISNATYAPEESDYSIPKNVELSVGSRSLDRFSKCIERTTDVRILEKVGKVLNECYIDLTLSKLRELDSDCEAQDRYILSRSKFLDRGMINILVIKLRLEKGEELVDQDYDYLNNLLTWRRNDIYMMPILDFGESIDRKDRLERYDRFVDRMLQDRFNWINGNCRIAMSIPDYIPRRMVDALFERYDDCGPTFVGIDFNNSRMDKPSDKVGTVLNHFRLIGEDETFLYGINAKPYRKGDDVSAWDIYLTHGSFNAIGPVHSKPRMVPAPAD